jgi:hypothetical protein
MLSKPFVRLSARKKQHVANHASGGFGRLSAGACRSTLWVTGCETFLSNVYYCQPIDHISQGSYTLLFWIAEALLGLPVWAVWGRDRVLALAMSVAFAVLFVLTIVGLVPLHSYTCRSFDSQIHLPSNVAKDVEPPVHVRGCLLMGAHSNISPIVFYPTIWTARALVVLRFSCEYAYVLQSVMLVLLIISAIISRELPLIHQNKQMLMFFFRPKSPIIICQHGL